MCTKLSAYIVHLYVFVLTCVGVYERKGSTLQYTVHKAHTYTYGYVVTREHTYVCSYVLCCTLYLQVHVYLQVQCTYIHMYSAYIRMYFYTCVIHSCTYVRTYVRV